MDSQETKKKPKGKDNKKLNTQCNSNRLDGRDGEASPRPFGTAVAATAASLPRLEPIIGAGRADLPESIIAT